MKITRRNVFASAQSTCNYRVSVQFGDHPETLTDYVITAPCGLSEAELYKYLPWDELDSNFKVISTENDKEDYRLSNDEIDYFDSAWGYKSGVPEEEYDEDLAKEGYYDDYYDEPRYSGYMHNLEWTVKLEYVGHPDITYEFSQERDVWDDNEDDIVQAAIEDAGEEYRIVSFEVI